jgi:hypothetical protein
MADIAVIMQKETAKLLMLAGAVLLMAGGVWYRYGDRLDWNGRLPGDIRVERDGFRFHFPITTMLLFSLLANLLWQLVRRFL